MDNTQKTTILERASAAEMARDYDQAAKLLQGLLEAEPEDTELISRLGNLYVKSGDDKKALSYFQKFYSLEPKNVSAMNSMGGIYRRMKMYDESIAILEEAIICDENNSQIFYNLGFTYKIMGKNDDALKCFERVVSDNPSDVLAYNHMGSIYASENKTEEAVTCYLHGLKADPNHPVLHLNLAKVYDKQGKAELAKQEYQSALKAKPYWIDAVEGYANVLIEDNSTSEAFNVISKTIELNPKNPMMHTKLGDVYSKQGAYDNAEGEYSTALKIDPEYKKALSGLANTYEATEKYDEALEIMDCLDEISPEDDSVKMQRASILLSAGKYDEANRTISALIENDSENAEKISLLGQYYICTGDENKASGCFKKIKSIDSKNDKFYSENAKRYLQTGNMEKAEEFYLRYIDNHKDTGALKNLADVYEKQGRLDEALNQYDQIKNIDAANTIFDDGIKRIKAQQEIPTPSETFDEPDFSDADDDIFLKSNEIPEVEEQDFTEPSSPAESSGISVEPAAAAENPSETELYDSFKNDDFAEETIFEDEYDTEDESTSDKYSSLDSLVADQDFDEPKETSFYEDDTNADDFFSKPAVPQRKAEAPKSKPMFEKDDFDNELEVEEEPMVLEEKTEEEPKAEETLPKPEPAKTEIPETKEIPLPEQKPARNEIPEIENDDIDPIEEEFPGITDLENNDEPEVFDAPEMEIESSDDEDFDEPEESEPEFDVDALLDDDLFNENDSEENAGDEFELPTEDNAGDEFELPTEDNALDAAEAEFEEEILNEESIPEEKIDISAEDMNFLNEEVTDIEMTPDFEEGPDENAENLSETIDVAQSEEPLEEEITEGEDEEVPTVEDITRKISDMSDTLDDMKSTSDEDSRILKNAAETLEEAAAQLATQGNFSMAAGLFKELKSLSDYLPEDKKQEFIGSKINLQLEYIISMLSGKKGLLKTASEERNVADSEISENGVNLLNDVLVYAKELTSYLPDAGASLSLNAEIDRILKATSHN